MPLTDPFIIRRPLSHRRRECNGERHGRGDLSFGAKRLSYFAAWHLPN
jgi:hypothetical protein